MGTGTGLNEPSDAVDLARQLSIAGVLVLVMTITHSLGLVWISRLLRLKDDKLREREFNASSVVLLGSFGLLLFALHMTEIFIFAAFYLLLGTMQTLEEALYYSATAYATLGWTADYFPVEWRLVGALEALIGFILIGWSTAFMVSTMKKLTD